MERTSMSSLVVLVVVLLVHISMGDPVRSEDVKNQTNKLAESGGIDSFEETAEVSSVESAPQLSKDCYTQRGCQCMLEWDFQGSTWKDCSNPDDDRAGSWCQLDEAQCSQPDGQFADSGAIYGYCSCRIQGLILYIPEQNQSLTYDNPPLASMLQEDYPTPTPSPPPSNPPFPTPSPPLRPSPSTPIPMSKDTDFPGSYQIESTDCLTIFNRGCNETIFQVAFADGDLLQSVSYPEYSYWQSSGWWNLLKEDGDYVRWCSPSKQIALFIQNEESGTIKSAQSRSEEKRCINTQAQFDILAYTFTGTASQNGEDTASEFYTLKGSQEQKRTCKELGGELLDLQIIPSNVTLVVGENCQFNDI